MASTSMINNSRNYLLSTPSASSNVELRSTNEFGSNGYSQTHSKNDYTLADVYDDAAIIGSELEKIITNYGSDVLKDLMPKVISVLELLENLTIKNEKENDELNDLRMRINSLEFEKAQRLNEREKYEKVKLELIFK